MRPDLESDLARVTAELAACKEDAEALRKDAERYQVVRENNLVDWDGIPYPKGYTHPDAALDDARLMLDAVLDAIKEGS